MMNFPGYNEQNPVITNGFLISDKYYDEKRIKTCNFDENIIKIVLRYSNCKNQIYQSI